jgi:hypothetical protein
VTPWIRLEQVRAAIDLPRRAAEVARHVTETAERAMHQAQGLWERTAAIGRSQRPQEQEHERGYEREQ